MRDVFLTGFGALEPRFQVEQEKLSAWTLEALCRSRESRGEVADEAFRARTALAIKRFSCGPAKLRTRGLELEDFTHLDWARMRIFRLHESSRGLGLEARMRFYDERCGEAVGRLYAQDSRRVAPANLLHVSCTGYAAPGPAQRFVASESWGSLTRVTNVYHLGCYAALPAIYLARAFAAAGGECSDIVHTELCSIHFDPHGTSPEEMVVQSLFADGFAKYSAVSRRDLRRRERAGLAILALDERIIAGTADHMSWHCSDWGFRMSLSRHVPRVLAERLDEFVTDLFRRADLNRAQEAERTVYALHPGGPRVLEEICETLRLPFERTSWSYRVFAERGNMSSATLPFVWKALLEDEKVEEGTNVVSLAFGPGLTVSGALFRKESP